MLYMYPDNLKGKPTLWLWYLRDIGVIGVGAIMSVIAISRANFYLPTAMVGCYAFLMIRVQDTSIFDFISYACAYFLFNQQFYLWKYTSSKKVMEEKKTNKKGRS